MAGVQYKHEQVEDVKIFYREAGSPSLPGLLLLHGHASASHTFRNLIPLLSDSFHIIAPDYPGFGNSDRPDPKDFNYTFEHIAELFVKLTEQIGLKKYHLYVFDFGAPVGFGMATRHPDRVMGIFTQSGNAYTDGVSSALGPHLQALWANPTGQQERDNVKHLFIPEGITEAYYHAVTPASLVSPDAPALDSYYTSRPGAFEIQMTLLNDYQNVLKAYPGWQEYLRTHKPKVVAVWGKGDPFFIPPGAEAFKRDVPEADVTIVENGGHFMNESHPEEIAKGVRKLL